MHSLFKSFVAEFHRLPSWIRKLGPWAFVAVGVTLLDALDEFAIAIGVLVLGLAAFAVQISEWKPTDERYVAVKKIAYGAVSIGVLLFLGVVFVKRKGQKPWSNIDAINTLIASGGKTIAFTYNNAPWRFVFTAAIACVVTWLIARAWFLMRPKRETGNAESANSGRQIDAANTLRGCQDEWLHVKLNEDKSRIKDLVRFPGIIYNPDFQKAQIDFGFSVFNNSLCDIVIEHSVSGEIRYGEDNDGFYYTPKFLFDEQVECASRSGAYFVIRQPIRLEEIPRFRDAENVLIWFHSLEINFHGTEQFPEIKQERLNTAVYLETKKRIWRDWNQLEFIFGYTDEQWAAISSGAIENTKRLEIEIGHLNSLSVAQLPESKTEKELATALAQSRTEIQGLQAEIARLSEGMGGKKQQFKDAQKTINEVVVRVIDCRIIGRSDDYVQFSLVIMNCSALPIVALEGPNGFILFHTRRLQGQVTRIANRFRNIGRGDFGYIELRQELTPADAVVISESQAVRGAGYWFDLRNLRLLASNSNNVSNVAEFTFEGVTIANEIIREP